MSKVLEQLRQAEEQRERIIAERKRLETEADAAQAAREREERVQGPVPAARTRQKVEEQVPRPAGRLGQWLRAGVLAMIIAAVVFFVLPGHEKPSLAGPATPFMLKLDRDAEAFAARAREKARE